MITRHYTSPFLLFISLFLMAHGLKAQTIVYGLNGIQHIKKNASAPFYIQMAAFKNKQFAQQFSKQQASSYPIKIEDHGAFHVVFMGPISTFSELQQLNQQKSQQHHKERRVTLAPTKNRTVEPKPKLQVSSQPMDLLLQKNAPVGKTLPAGYHTTTRHTFKKAHMTANSTKNIKYPQLERTDTPATPYRDRPITLNFSVGIGSPSYADSIKVSNGSEFPAPYDSDTLSTKKNTQALLSVGIGKRYKPEIPSVKSLILGARYQYLVPNNIGKDLTQYSSPEFLNYNYHWSMTAQVLTAEAKTNFIREAKLSPYVNVGVGVTFNQAKGYMETALPSVTERYSPAFASKSAAQFVWHAGVGFDYDISRDLIASVGYDFQAFGPFSSGSGVSTWQAESLQLGNANTNMAVLGITYLIR